MFRGPRSFSGFDRRVWILFSGRVISSTGFSIVMPFLSIYLAQQLGLPMTDIGLLFLGTAVVGAAGQMVGGELADRLGRKPVMWASMALRGSVFVMLSVVIATSMGYAAIAVLLMISSFMGSLFEPASNAIIADMVPPGRRMEAYSILRVGQNVGWTLGPLLGGILAMISYSSLFLFSAATSITVAIVILMLIVDPIRTTASRDKFHPRDLLKIKDNKLFLLFCLAALPLAIVLGQMSSTFAVYSDAVVGISTAEIGYLYAINGIMVVLIQIPVARYISRFKMSYVLAFGAMMYAFGYLLVAFAPDFWFLAVTMVITTTGELLTSPSSTNLVANMSPENERGRYMGVFGLFSQFGWSMGPFFGGILYDAFAHQPIFLWSGVALIATTSAVGFLYLGRLASDKYDRVMGSEPADAKG